MVEKLNIKTQMLYYIPTTKISAEFQINNCCYDTHVTSKVHVGWETIDDTLQNVILRYIQCYVLCSFVMVGKGPVYRYLYWRWRIRWILQIRNFGKNKYFYSNSIVTIWNKIMEIFLFFNTKDGALSTLPAVKEWVRAHFSPQKSLICVLLVKLEQKINHCFSVLNQRVAHEEISYLASGHIFVIMRISDILYRSFQSWFFSGTDFRICSER